jgi:hypothetical protein
VDLDWLPAHGQEAVDVPVEGGGQSGQDVGEVGERIEAVGFGGFDEAGGDSAGLSALVASGEEPVFASDGDFAECALGGVVVDGEAAVIELAGEDRPAFEEVADGAGGRGFRGQRG